MKLILNLSPGRQPLPNLHSGDTPLLSACRRNNHKIVVLLLTHSPKLLLVQDRQCKHSALHILALSGDIQMIHLLVAHIKYLLEQGELTSDSCYALDFLNVEKVTPLLTACKHNHKAIIKLLIDLQNEFPSVPLININRAIGDCKRTLLHIAIENCNLDIVLALLSSVDIDVNVLAKPSKKTCQYLIDTYTSKCNSSFSENSGQFCAEESGNLTETALAKKKCEMTINFGKQEVVITILPTSKSENSFLDVYITPLAEACIYGSKIIIESLLQHGAVDKNGIACRLCRYLSTFDLEQLILSYHCSFDSFSSTKLKKKRVDVEVPLGIKLNWSSMSLTTCNRAWMNNEMSYVITPSRCTTKTGVTLSISELSRYNYTSVKAVDLSKNNLDEVPLELFCLPNVTDINLSQNKISVLPVNPYTCFNAAMYGWDCKLLQVLNLSCNQLHELPSCLWMLPYLREVQAQVNNLLTFPTPLLGDDWMISDSLAHINVSRNKVEVLPEMIWVLTSLKELNLGNNSITFSGLNFPLLFKVTTQESEQSSYHSKSIIMKYCAHTQSKSVSSGHERVEELSFGYRRSVDFFESGYSSLSKLVLSSNCLTEFPEALPCFTPNLQELDVSNNTFEQIDFHFIPQLVVKFVARNCQLWNFGNVLLKERHAYNVTNCCNIFRKLTKSVICHHRSHAQLPFLKELNLSGNKLTHMQLLRHPPSSDSEDCPFTEEERFMANASSTNLLYPNLQILNLERNDLIGVFNSNIGHQSKLQTLLLSGNTSLEALPNQLGLLNLSTMSIQDTPSLADPPQEYQRIKSRDNLDHLLRFLKARMKR